MFKFKRRIGPKGQIVLPRDIRLNLGLRTGSEVVFHTKDKNIIMEPAEDQLKILDEFCTLPINIKKRRITVKEIKESIESEFEERYKRIKWEQ